jgi:hypothetical protein
VCSFTAVSVLSVHHGMFRPCKCLFIHRAPAPIDPTIFRSMARSCSAELPLHSSYIIILTCAVWLCGRTRSLESRFSSAKAFSQYPSTLSTVYIIQGLILKGRMGYPANSGSIDLQHCTVWYCPQLCVDRQAESGQASRNP